MRCLGRPDLSPLGSPVPRRSGRRLAALWVGLALLPLACGPPPEGSVDVRIPEGADLRAIAAHLEDAGLVKHPRLFSLYVRLRGTERTLKAGRYRFRAGASWDEVLVSLERGEVLTIALTIPEGLALREIAPRLAGLSGVPPDSVLALGRDTAAALRLGVPGPTLEGYLFPDTYRFSEGIAPLEALRVMVDRYRAFWGEEERRLADSLGLSEREVVTLASIVEAEARVAEERRVIAGVYLNRLQRGMLLQADPTVQFALGTPKERLLYRDIDSVADHPYNTYAHPGLPPGPICSPGEASLRAVLRPAETPYLFFVARPDGSHVFSVTERDHINAKNSIRRGEWTAPPGEPSATPDTILDRP